MSKFIKRKGFQPLVTMSTLESRAKKPKFIYLSKSEIEALSDEEQHEYFGKLSHQKFLALLGQEKLPPHALDAYGESTYYVTLH